MFAVCKIVAFDLQYYYVEITHVVDMLRGSTVLLGDYNMPPCYISWLYRHVYDMYWVLWLLTGLIFHDWCSFCWGFLSVVLFNDHMLFHNFVCFHIFVWLLRLMAIHVWLSAYIHYIYMSHVFASTQFSQEWVCRKVVVKHSINLNPMCSHDLV